MTNMSPTYGSPVRAPELIRLLDHLLTQTAGAPPLCVWGKHGIGKTQIVREFAQQQGWGFRQIAPAQFEEMGDLLGMPAIADGQTVLRPPSWVPRESGPGILLLDDINRADDRILRGLMPLLQEGRLISWELPAPWHIVLTANPDQGDYSVTPMDEAMLTRMVHLHLQFDVTAWLDWAGRCGLDIRGIDFVARYPELITGRRTTARSLEQFLRLAAPVADWRKEIQLVQQLASACLDEETVAGLLQFIRTDLRGLPTAEGILAKGPADLPPTLTPTQYWTLSERLNRHLAKAPKKLSDSQQEHLKDFLLVPDLPADLRFALAQRLTALQRSDVLQILSDPKVSEVILGER